MRRPLLAVLLSTAFLLVLVACGDDADAHHSSRSPSGGAMGGETMGGHHRSTPVADGARRIEVAATSFAFDPDEITVTAGEDIAIVLTSDDVVHDFTIDDVDVHVAAGRGETAEGGLRADEPGEYAFYCAVTNHREAGMEGTLVVEEP